MSVNFVWPYLSDVYLMFPLQVQWEVPEKKQTECIKKGKDAEVSGFNPSGLHPLRPQDYNLGAGSFIQKNGWIT